MSNRKTGFNENGKEALEIAKTIERSNKVGLNFEKLDYENPYYVICPDCGKKAYYDTVDIGVGLTQCGPAGCDWCGWIQKVEVD